MMAISLAVTVQITEVLIRSSRDVGIKETAGLRPCPDGEASGRRDLWPPFKVRVHPRKVRRGAQLHNREKHMEKSRPKSRGAAGKTSEGFV